MKKITATISMVLLFLSPAWGKTIFLDNNQISFEAPDDFAPLTEDVKKLKYPSSRAPKYVIGNRTAATTIAYDLKPHHIPQDKIDEVRHAFAQMFPRMIPNLKWVENKTIELSGRKWGYMEMTSSAIDTDIYNLMIFTGYKGQMLMFNFNSTKEEFKKYEKVLRESIKTIQIN